MARLARRAFHASLEETLAWLDHLQSSTEPEPRELLIFGREVLPRFARLLPELVEAVNDDEAEAGDAPPATRGREAPGPAAVELISARVRRAADRDETERQCIGPVVGRLGGCAGRGAATDGWQPESAENFASKRGSRVQARCKACDGLRMRPKPAAAITSLDYGVSSSTLLAALEDGSLLNGGLKERLQRSQQSKWARPDSVVSSTSSSELSALGAW